MRLVILESPFAASDNFTVEENIAYAKRCLHDCLTRGEAPIASHLLFTQPGVLDDNKPEERKLSMAAGLAWYRVAEVCAVYLDHGVSRGMEQGIAVAKTFELPIDERTLPDMPALDTPKFQPGDFWFSRDLRVFEITAIATKNPPGGRWLMGKLAREQDGRWVSPAEFATHTWQEGGYYFPQLGEHERQHVSDLTTKYIGDRR